jgi:phosphatidylinositol alpha-1,6-mannosyltransferase
MELDQTKNRVEPASLALYTLEYPPQKGGVASYLAGLVHALSEAPRVVYVHEKLRRKRLCWLPLVAVMRHDDAQKGILVSHVLPMGTAAFFAKVFGGPAYSVIFHGLDLLYADRSAWKRWLVKVICQNASLLVVNSQTTADILKRFTDRLPLVLTPGVQPKEYLSKQAARMKLGVGVGERVVLGVARLVPRKGFDVLIEAVGTLREPVRLVMIGRGPDEERLRACMAGSGGRSTLELKTDVADEERDLWCAAADVFALPVREEKDDIEGFGMVFLEAAMASLPVVAGKSGGIAEAVVDGVTGSLVDPRNAQAVATAIQTFFDHPTLAGSFGEAGRSRALRDFAWRERAQQFDATYPLVSVVIPAYNRVHLLKKTLESLVHQTYRYMEVIVVDDGSKEDVASVVAGFKDRLSIRFERLSQNQGAPVARNRGFALSRGEYVLFLDADATLCRGALECFVVALREHLDVDVVYSAFRFGWKHFASREFGADALRQGNYIHTSSMLRRSAFPGFDERLTKFQDWDLWLTMSERGSKMLRVPYTLFRLRSGGTMSAWLPSFFHRLPWKQIGWMPAALTRYREAEVVVKKKHGID